MTSWQFVGAVARRMMDPAGVPSPRELAAWMRETCPEHAEPWAARLNALPDDLPRYLPLPDELNLHHVHFGRTHGYDSIAPPSHFGDVPEPYARLRWWTPGATAGGNLNLADYWQRVFPPEVGDAEDS